MANNSVLILPGWQNSGPSHWQTLWEQQHPGFRRVQQQDWEEPKRADWLHRITEEVNQATDPVVFVGHSLGCISMAHWCQSPAADGKVKGALLVAPADVDRADAPSQLKDFAPIPKQRFPFPSIVVASSNDPYLAVNRARELAEAWGSTFVEIGSAGHINGESGLGDWPEGKRMLRRLLGS
jgi:predicted alpha/beta hydrolase family esterase